MTDNTDRELWVNEAVRPWLIACGKNLGKIGVAHAYHYRWPDAQDGGRIRVPYFTYRRVGSKPQGNPGITNANLLDPDDGTYDVILRAQQLRVATVRIDLYNHPFGDDVLSACSIAAQKDPDITANLAANNAEYKSDLTIIDDTKYDDDEIIFHHYMTCEMVFQAIYRHKKTNERIAAVEIDGALTM